MFIDFSIIVPTLNSAKYLQQTLNSIKQQDKKLNIECIFSDGGSSDNTIKIIKDFNEINISKIILYEQIGLSKALNSGFKVANGNYLTFLNSDDLLAPDALHKVKYNFEKYEHSKWSVGLCENFGKKNLINKIVNFYKSKSLNILDFKLLCINNIISQPSVYWKNSFFQKVGSFDEQLKYNMDYDMWLRMISVSKPLRIYSTLSYFRRHNSSLSHQNLLKQFFEKYETMKKYNKNIIFIFLHIIISSIIILTYKISNY